MHEKLGPEKQVQIIEKKKKTRKCEHFVQKYTACKLALAGVV